MKNYIVIFCAAVFATTAFGGEAAKTDVQEAVRERTGKSVRVPSGENGDMGDIVDKLLRRKLTAEGAAQIALLNNGSLQATLEEIGISQAELREAGMLKNPRIDLSIRFPDRPPSAMDAEEAVAFDFLDLLMLPLRKHVAAAQFEQTKLRVADEVISLAAETKAAFYALQAQMQLAEAMKLSLDASQAAVQLAQKQHEAGNITDLVLANQQMSYSEARLEVAMAEAEIRAKREKLNRLMGLWGARTNWKAVAKLPAVPDSDFSTEHLESIAVAQRLDLAAARAQLAGVVQALGLVKTYRYIGAMEIGVDTERNPDRSNYTGPTLQIEIPIFNQGQARIAKGQAQLRQAENRFRALAIDIRSEVREKRDALIAKRDIALFYRDEMLPERAQIVKLMQVQYNAMLTGVYEVLLVKQNELATQRGYVEATRDYWITRAELERAVGGNLNPKKQMAEGDSKAVKISKSKGK